MQLPVNQSTDQKSGGCGDHCGEGLEKVYPTTVVRYGAMNWLGEFTRKPDALFNCGGKVVVRTERGTELGEQVSLTCNGCQNSVSREQMQRYIEASGAEYYEFRRGHILRKATPDDVTRHRDLTTRAVEERNQCQELAERLDLRMKIVMAEHLLGGERLIFYFRAPHRIDFRQLVRDLAAMFDTRIEMRQVNPREEARVTADYEICGRECCCKAFLKNMRPINMKMARIQKATLDPTQVSGRCGRLRCCLRYEHEGYEELLKKLPPLGAVVESAHGVGEVIDRQILTQLVLLRIDERRQLTVPVEEITSIRSMPKFDEPHPDAEGDDPRRN